MGVISESQTPWGMPGQQLRIFTGAEIDGSITEMAKRYRHVSYARSEEGFLRQSDLRVAPMRIRACLLGGRQHDPRRAIRFAGTDQLHREARTGRQPRSNCVVPFGLSD